MQHAMESRGAGLAAAPVYESEDLVRRAEERKQAGNEHMKKQEYAEAVKVYSEAIRLHPKGSAFWLNRAIAQRHAENWEAAASDANMAAELQPTSPKVHYILALCHQQMKQYKQALQACELGLMMQADNKALLQIQQEVLRVKDEADRKEAKLAQMASLFSRPDQPSAPSRSSSSSESSSNGSPAGVLDPFKPAKKVPRALTEADAPYQELHSAASSGDLDVCSRLLGSGQIRDLDWTLPEDGNTALHVAADNDHEDILRMLLAAKANPEARNDFGLSPFCLAERGTGTYNLLVRATRKNAAHRRNARKTGAVVAPPAEDWTRFDV